MSVRKESAHVRDHTIVTSDSLGSVTFWDGASLAQKQTFQAHKADGMCLLIGPVSCASFKLTVSLGEQSSPLDLISEYVNSHESAEGANQHGSCPVQRGYIHMMFEHSPSFHLIRLTPLPSILISHQSLRLADGTWQCHSPPQRLRIYW